MSDSDNSVASHPSVAPTGLTICRCSCASSGQRVLCTNGVSKPWLLIWEAALAPIKGSFGDGLFFYLLWTFLPKCHSKHLTVVASPPATSSGEMPYTLTVICNHIKEIRVNSNYLNMMSKLLTETLSIFFSF